MIDPGTVVTVAGILSGFGITVMMFRIQRELERRGRFDHVSRGHRFAWADWLVIVPVSASLLVVAMVMTLGAGRAVLRFATALCSGSASLMAGYLPAILAHYGIGPWPGLFKPTRRSAEQPERQLSEAPRGPRRRPELERAWVLVVAGIAVLIFFGTFLGTR
jgi:hypothetical protein